MKLSPEQEKMAHEGPLPLILDKINELEEHVAELENKDDKTLDITVTFV